MKKILLSVCFSLLAIAMFGQCDKLFISEYVEGGNNNKALELYNPTSAPIDLSEYSVGRFSNGSTSYTGIDLPAEMIQPYETYVIVLDKRDPNGTGNEYPVWDGYQEWDYCTDLVTGDTLLYADGDTIFCVQFDPNNNNEPFYGTEYHEWLDLQGKANVFLCPVYAVNNAMYFNGNDAVALVKGSTVSGSGDNIWDVVGVIGNSAMADELSWVDSDGGWLTRDRTLERKSNIEVGTGAVVHQDTFEYAQWNVWGKNNFYGLGAHGCECDPDFVASTKDLNQVAFNIFPNPVSDWMTIEAAENIQRVEVYNLMGQMVMNRNVEDFAEQVNLNTSQLDFGMYVISLFFEDEKQSVTKFIKR